MKQKLPLLIILLCIIVMWSIYGKLSNSYAVATVVSGSRENVLETEALFIRNEYPVKVDGDGYFQNSAAGGSKVHKGQTIGYYYIGEPDKELISKINVINEKIKAATNARSTEEAFVDDTISIDNKIAAYTKEISELASAGNQEEINKIRAQIDVLLERKAAIAGGTTSTKVSVIDTLTAQKQELENQLMGNKTGLFAPAPGIFSISADGLEETLNLKSIETLTVSTVEEILSQKEYTVDKSIYPLSICKVIDNSEWIMAIVCEEKKVQGIHVGNELEVRFTDEGDIKEKCVVKKISDPEDGKVVLYLKGSVELAQLQNARKTAINIVLKNYKGLQIPAKALKNEAGKDVVYVAGGSEKQMKYVNVLYKDNDLAIVEENNQGENPLLLYDEVVLE